MKDFESFDEMLKHAAEGYHPPPTPDREGMWDRIATERANRARVRHSRARFTLSIPQSIAAGILLLATGAVVGRKFGAEPVTVRGPEAYSAASPTDSSAPPASSTVAAPSTVVAPALPQSTSRTDLSLAEASARAPRGTMVPALLQSRLRPYLASSAELITAFRVAARKNEIDPTLVSRSTALLGETRVLEDSAAGSDPSLRRLLADLDLVLMQIAQYASRASASPNPIELDLIEDSIKRRRILAELQSRATPQEPRHTPNEMESTR